MQTYKVYYLVIFMKNAIVLCSGGLDSSVTAYYIKNKLGYDKITIMFFNYGQRTINQERKASRDCAKKIGAKFMEIKLDWIKNISNSLITKNNKVRHISKIKLKDTKKESEKFYVPCRNTIFLVYALSFAEAKFISKKHKSDIFVGFKCEGKESYPDTTIEFVKQMNKLAKTSCSYSAKIIAPLIKKDKEDIVLLGKKLGVNFKDTFSCYASNDARHCGYCLACMLRKQGFYWAGIEDPTEYD